ncbi:MAG TPA: hypothetical protein VE604_12730 [Candidatus Polarisedimenticolia bacterium]|nr:hypothetical protein [Candidatus Polarisedimenticolia bacterium]
MKKLNTHEIYSMGQLLLPITKFSYSENMALGPLLFPMFRAKWNLEFHMKLGGILSPSCRRAAGALIRAFHDLGLPEDADKVFDVDPKTIITSAYSLNQVVQKVKDFETVLANELPGLATYFVLPKGIYSTDDLITQAVHHLPSELRGYLSRNAIDDIKEAGKCLAFEIPTGSAFHMWRAVESVMNDYYKNLTGKTFLDAGVARNWGKYIDALKTAKAEKKITVFLDHIREEYRNPIAHPDDTLELTEAFNLFGAAFSVMGQMLNEIQTLSREAEEKALTVIPEQTDAVSGGA